MTFPVSKQAAATNWEDSNNPAICIGRVALSARCLYSGVRTKCVAEGFGRDEISLLDFPQAGAGD